jgi:seryl-tRNA synthetase
MIDLKKVRDDIQAYKNICEKRHMNIDVDAVIALDDQRKALQLEVDQTKAQQKQLAAAKDYE